MAENKWNKYKEEDHSPACRAAVRGCRPCADLKRFITDSKARSPKQREAEKTFMLKISCPNRETQFSSQGRYPNGCRLQQSLTAKGECDPSISTLHKEEIYKLECFLSPWFTAWRSDRLAPRSMGGRTRSIHLVPAHFTKCRHSYGWSHNQTHAQAKSSY